MKLYVLKGFLGKFVHFPIKGDRCGWCHSPSRPLSSWLECKCDVWFFGSHLQTQRNKHEGNS